MRVKDRQVTVPPKNTTYCYTRWMGVVHITDNGKFTECGNVVGSCITHAEALESTKNLCNGCFAYKK